MEKIIGSRNGLQSKFELSNEEKCGTESEIDFLANLLIDIYLQNSKKNL